MIRTSSKLTVSLFLLAALASFANCGGKEPAASAAAPAPAATAAPAATGTSAPATQQDIATLKEQIQQLTMTQNQIQQQLMSLMNTAQANSTHTSAPAAVQTTTPATTTAPATKK